MKISISFDFGDVLIHPSGIKVKYCIESTLGSLMLAQDMRKAIADAIIPHLEKLQMSDRGIQDEVNRILYAGKLLNNLPFPYYISQDGYEIKSSEDEEFSCTIQSLLEGKVPDISVESLNLF